LTKQRTAEATSRIVNALCRPGSCVDLVQDIVRPICDIMFESILGTGAAARSDVGVSPSQIFDLYLGLNRRKKINTEACAMLRDFASAGDN